MKTIKITFLAIILLASCSKESDDMATPSSSSSGTVKSLAKPRPFSAILNATADPNSPPTSCSGDVPFAAPDFTVNGTASHMGELIQPSTLHHVSCDLSSTTMLFTTSVSGQMAANNGDLIYYTGNDVVNVAALLTQTGTTGALTGTWTVTGGTGRFTGASGSFTVSGTVDFVTNSFTCQCVGTISY